MTDPLKSSRIDTSVAHPARRYDYLLGGKDNFEADRQSADEIEKRHPTARLSALENRFFMHRAVRFMARQGIRQFLDIGTGIPTSPNTHEIAQETDASARIVYVDNDPLVLVHARALLTGAPQGRTTYIEADLRRPAEILDDPGLRATLDLSQPVGLLLIAVLHFIRDDDDPRAILDTLIGALPAGSIVAASNATPEYMPAEQITALRKVMERQWQDRTGAELTALFTHPDLRLVAPGVQSVSQWWPEDAPQPRPPVADIAANGLVAEVVRDRP
ncbi:SAM-dependent methyltransferase [Actinoplanes awajinensis]|uniref:Methyltransferase n=1 Tax=Actinoplanes awajinensis subsp. mycoplanecinus TaxID=135947 RepID=A0A0X3V932_9ACTN|nr:SAM-dependent methyltransferase [Actinoplanes awajinensis]KUL41208.1 methyltransferase [Actinoplanes awajinensis subsp. mycoplanecinus]